MLAYLLRALRPAAKPVLALSTAAALICAVSPAYAMRVSPMVAEMTTSGTNAVARIQVQNLNQGLLSFETRITRIEFREDGTIEEFPADEDFLVFPPQGQLAPSARQVIRLQWVGPADMPASRGYYLSVNQLPIQLSAQDAGSPGANVQVVYHMKALITVAPPKAEPKVEAVSIRPIMVEAKAPPSGEGEATPAADKPGSSPGLEIVLRNNGNRYAMMAGVRWVLEGKDKAGKPLKLTVMPDEINREIGVGYLPPLGGTRTFKLPTSAEFGPAPVKISFVN
ncbi:fimbrial chaperone protein [Sphingobium faniae]|nr:fimbrial chaperone protein [Sphingobium faniae]